MRGKLYLVSIGPGSKHLIPPLAWKAIRSSEEIVSYDRFLRWIREELAAKAIHTFPLTQERERAFRAIELARAGKQVSLISSGDIGIFAMAGLAFELMEEQEPFQVEVIPGITAANACASLLGAPLSHDFAVLSLSDLLCPWDWIEKRATSIAQADLAAVLYNVQSQARQQGIYRILRIMLEYKLSTTWCGVVRNAYREEQKIAIMALEDLLDQQFDMLTTIIVGNHFTRRKGNFLFTPRGYLGWQSSDQDVAGSTRGNSAIPHHAYWVFSGTSDGNRLAAEMKTRGYSVIVSTATEYGKAFVKEKYPQLPVTGGRKGIALRRQELQESSACALIDATHPFATKISSQLMRLSAELKIPYLRLERPGSQPSGTLESPSITVCQTMEEAAKVAIAKGKRIFLATGSKDLAIFLDSFGSTRREWFIRTTPDPSIVQRAIDCGVPANHICAVQGPFTQAFNEALWQSWQVDCIVTKDSGEAGGYQAKAAAALTLDIPLIVIKRPTMTYPNCFADPAAILNWLENREEKSRAKNSPPPEGGAGGSSARGGGSGVITVGPHARNSPRRREGARGQRIPLPLREGLGEGFPKGGVPKGRGSQRIKGEIGSD